VLELALRLPELDWPLSDSDPRRDGVLLLAGAGGRPRLREDDFDRSEALLMRPGVVLLRADGVGLLIVGPSREEPDFRALAAEASALFCFSARTRACKTHE